MQCYYFYMSPLHGIIMSTPKESLISQVSYIKSISFSLGFVACWLCQGSCLQVTEVSFGWKDIWRLLKLMGQLQNYLGQYIRTIGPIGGRWQALENTTMSHSRGSLNLPSLHSSTTVSSLTGPASLHHHPDSESQVRASNWWYLRHVTTLSVTENGKKLELSWRLELHILGKQKTCMLQENYVLYTSSNYIPN